jgi:steroid 5-alpha reductase family enzyme
MSKTASLVRVLVVYVIAFGVFGAWFAWGPGTGRLWMDGLIADLLATVVVFVASRVTGNSSFYDPYWSVLPPLLALAWWVELGVPADDVRAWLVMLVILLWAVRLTGNWIYTWPGIHHEDWRYPMLKEKAGRSEFVVDLMGIHVFPTFVVFAGMLPVYLVLTYRDRAIGWLDVIALGVGIGAVVLEFVADLQMHRFAAAKEPGQVMDRGLWSWSRHPNYVGEVSFWLALGFFGLAAAPGAWAWALIGTVLMLAMFLGASIPMMEKRSLERRPAYQDVVNRVSLFIPRPPRKST